MTRITTENSPKTKLSASKRWRVYFRVILAVIVVPILLLLMSVITLRWVDPSVTSFTLREDWKGLEMERYNLRDYWVSSEEIPDHLKWAVVASEDQLFWEHRGFDIESIREAWDDRQEGRRSRGASSISQQVAKNLFLSSSQSLFRKGIEAGITVLIELFWPKERIIEVYLNIAEFGPGIFGVGKASDKFWNIRVSQIDADKSARLASVLPSPKRMRVEPPSPYAFERSRWILRQMTQLTGVRYEEPMPIDSDVSDDPELEDIDPYLLQIERELEELLNIPSDSTSEEPDSIIIDRDSIIFDQDSTVIEYNEGPPY